MGKSASPTSIITGLRFLRVAAARNCSTARQIAPDSLLAEQA